MFYDVGPSDVQKQTGRTADAFAKFEKQFEEETDHEGKRKLIEKIKGWRSALTEVADLAGLDLRNQVDGYISPHLFLLHILAIFVAVQTLCFYKIQNNREKNSSSKGFHNYINGW